MTPLIALIDTGVADWVDAGRRLEFGDFQQHEPAESHHGTQMADLLRRWAPPHRLWSLRSYVPNASTLEHYLEARERLKAALHYLIEEEPPQLVMVAQAVIGPDEELYEAVRHLTDGGVCIVAAALRLGSGGPWGPDRAFNTEDDAYPGAYPEVLTVTYADRMGYIPPHASVGWSVDLAATGSAMARRLDKKMQLIEGASVSVARAVASLAWLYAREGPTTTWWEMRGYVERLRNHARDLQRGIPVLNRVVRFG